MVLSQERNSPIEWPSNTARRALAIAFIATSSTSCRRDSQRDPALDVVEVAEAEDRHAGAGKVGPAVIEGGADVVDELIGRELRKLVLAQGLVGVVWHFRHRMGVKSFG